METLNDEVDDIAQSLEARREEPVDREQVREILKREDDMFDSDAPGERDLLLLVLNLLAGAGAAAVVLATGGGDFVSGGGKEEAR